MQEIDANKLADLHIHTLEGSFDAVNKFEEVLINAKQNGCEYIGITDHNSFKALNQIVEQYGLDKSKPYWQIDGIKIVPGVEITCQANIGGMPKNTHLLVYSPNFSNSYFKQLINLKEKHDYYEQRFYLDYVCEQLGVELDKKLVNQYCRKNNVTYFNFDKVYKLFKYYKVNYNPKKLDSLQSDFYLPHYKLNIKDVIDLAHNAGGICVVAHPTATFKTTQEQLAAAKYFANLKVDGIEIAYGMEHKNKCRNFVESFKQERNINQNNSKIYYSAGSDNHQITKVKQIGKLYYYNSDKTLHFKNLKSNHINLSQAIESKMEKQQKVIVADSIIKKTDISVNRVANLQDYVNAHGNYLFNKNSPKILEYQNSHKLFLDYEFKSQNTLQTNALLVNQINNSSHGNYSSM